MSANSLAPKFSARFLRDACVFPCQAKAGCANTLVLADPTDSTVIHAAQLVLGLPLAIEVASFEDITTVLAKRLEEDEALAQSSDEGMVLRGEDDAQEPSRPCQWCSSRTRVE